MKNLLTKTHPATLVVSWFAIISVVAMVLTSCGAGHVGCDAYGNIDNDTQEFYEDNNS